jgi:UDP:flavonoid glycosyltransferase YjiC (YdhE family)
LTTIGSLGDLHPLIAIGLGLRAGGHSVAFVTTDLYRMKIEALGFEFHALRPHVPPDDKELFAYILDRKRGPKRLLREVLFPALRDGYEDLYSIAKDADFMLAGEIVYAAPLVAEKVGLTWATYVTAPMSFFSAYDPPVLAPQPWLAKLRPLGPTINGPAMNLAKLMTRSWGEPVRTLRRELELPPAANPVFEGKYSPHLVLAGFSPCLGKSQPDWPRNTVITGFTFYDGKREGAQLTPQLETFLAAGEPPIIFTLGSAAVYASGRFFEESAKAARLLNRRAVLLMGENLPPAGLSKHVIATNYAPFSDIFPRACAIVHQGGIGTVAQALRSGHPTLVTPYAFDQPDNAARLVRLGTSKTIQRDAYKAERVAAELEQLLNQARYRERVAAIARCVRDEDGTRVACEAIERQARGYTRRCVS